MDDSTTLQPAKKRDPGINEITNGDTIQLSDGRKVAIINKKAITRHFCLAFVMTPKQEWTIIQMHIEKNGGTSVSEYKGGDYGEIFDELTEQDDNSTEKSDSLSEIRSILKDKQN